MAEMKKTLAVFSGSQDSALAQEIAEYLGIKLGDVTLEQFANGENYVCYGESIRGADVFIVQVVKGTAVNDSLMELLIMVDAAKRASARTVTAVVPSYFYARQDRKASAREPITGRLVANLMETAGVDRIFVDMEYSGKPVNHLTAMPILVDYFRQKGIAAGDQLCIVSPDVGRAKAAKKFADSLDADLAIMHKGRPGHNQAEITAFFGDVAGKVCILNDDMIDTGGSIVAAATTLMERGAKEVYVSATHPVFSGPAYERLEAAPVKEIVVTNTHPIPAERLGGKIKVVTVAPLLAEAISRIFNNESVRALGDANL